VCLFTAALLTGCGGGGGGGGGGGSDGGSGNPPPNRLPTANAGADQSVKRNVTVRLDGTSSADSDGDALAYRWVQTSGTAVTLDSSTSAQPSFTAPNQSGTLTFSLIANDGKADSTADLVAVTVTNTAPTAASATSMAVGLGQVATLDGTGSTDADGDSLTYTWTQLSGPSVIIENVAPGIGRFPVPYTPVVFVFALTVSDGEATSVTINITINVTVAATPPSPPIAYAGWDCDVARRSIVGLYGWGVDANYDNLTYSWEQTGGPTVALSNANTTSPSFTAPETPAQLRFRLRVSDGTFTSEPDEVVVNVRNFAPEVYNAGITPGAAYTADTLVANAQPVDPDGDVLTATYEWRRNGTLVGGQTSSTFPANLTTKNDVISVRMTFDDGLEQTFVDASTVILDSPAVLSAQTPPPTSLNYGATANFTVTATDPDGDAIAGYAIVYGPAGFNITDQGNVSWIAAGPLFDRLTDFNWAVRVRGDESSLLSGTIEVRDATRVYPLRRNNIGIPVEYSGLRIADLDGDGDEEMLVGSSQAVYVLTRSGSGYRQSWVYPFEIGTAQTYSVPVSAVAARDIDGDSRQEIFFSKSDRLVRLDGIARREAASRELRCRGLEFADLDGNGTAELACLASDMYSAVARIAVLNPTTLAELWSTPEMELGYDMAVGNVDGDAALELVTSGGYVFDGASHQNQWAYSQPFGNAVEVGDMDADGVDEIVAVSSGIVRAYSAVYRSPLWEYAPSPYFGPYSLTVADANGDGRLEAIGGTSSWGDVISVGYNTTTHQPELLWQINAQEYGVSSIAVGDVDDDGTNEVVWGAGAGSSGRDDFVIAGFTPTISVKWQSDTVPQIDGAFYGGALARVGGGVSRLMFSTLSSDSGYSGVRAIALTPMTGEVDASPQIDYNWTTPLALDIADVDNDNIDELLVGKQDYSSSHFATYDIDSWTVEWQSPQLQSDEPYAIEHADMNGDGRIDLVGLTNAGYVEIHDIHSQSLLWRSTRLGASVSLALADLDDDGELEIIVALNDRIVIYGRALLGSTYLERASVAQANVTDLVVSDLDGDNDEEIYVLNANWFSNATLSVYDADLQLLRATHLGTPATAIFVEESSFARKNLLLSVGTPYSYPYTHPQLWAVDPVSGADVWRSPPLAGGVQRNALQFIDVTGDGEPEITFGTTGGMYHTR
jgi:hypothetical protein